MGWNEWQQVYADQLFAQRVGGGAIRRMQHVGMSRAFSTWQYEAAEMARDRQIVAGALRRMLFRKLSMGLIKWRLTAAVMARTTRMLSGGLNRMRCRARSRAWQSWRAFSSLDAVRSKHAKELASLQQQLARSKAAVDPGEMAQNEGVPNSLNSLRARNFDTLFDTIDTNKNGVIDREEFRRLYKQVQQSRGSC